MNDEQRRLRKWFEREQHKPRRSVIEALDSLELGDGDRVADIGCGPGVHLKHILQKVAPTGQVVGIDTSPERLAVAREMLKEEIERDSIRIAEGDLHALSTDLGPFDLVWMSLVLHHEDIPVDVVGGLREVVRPGGRIAILDGDDLASFPFLPWPPELEMSLRQAVARAAEEGTDPRWFSRRFTARNLPAILIDAGLIDVKLRAFTEIRQAPLDDWDVRDVEDWLRNSFGSRVREFLAPADWQRFEALCSADSPNSMFYQPGFFISRTWFLGVGTST